MVGGASEPHVLDRWCVSFTPFIGFVVQMMTCFLGLIAWFGDNMQPRQRAAVATRGRVYGIQDRFGSFHIRILILIMHATFRIGEAANPGTDDFPVWTVGTCNPTGLTSKSDIVSVMDGDFWGMTETHLSHVGVRHLRTALRSQNSEFKYFVPGAPCELRPNSDSIGNFTGVAALSKWPTRALPHDLDQQWYNSARVQIVGSCIESLWIQIAIVYGYPYSTSHRFPRFQTEQLLEGVVDRIGLQTTGPRIVMGDFNWLSSELDQVRRLEEMGFRELQSIALEWWGRDIVPTGHSRQIDFVFISPELLPLLKDVIVDPTHWPDHASVQGVFAGGLTQLERFTWRMPQPVEWPQMTQPIQLEDLSNPTRAFAQMWNTVESVASTKREQQGKPPFAAAQLGRAQTFDTQPTRPSQCLIRKSRTGEVQPEFAGVSFRYAQQFRQVRRLQALVKSFRKSPDTPGLNALWNSIRHSIGFPGGFGHWWTTVGHAVYGGPQVIPLVLPKLDICEVVFEGVLHWVTSFGKELKQSRVRLAKRRRQLELHYVFKDCARDPPKQVDLLVNTKSAGVVEIDHHANTIALDQPSPFVVGRPISAGGHAMELIDQFDNELAVEAMAPIDPGVTIRQTTVITQVSAVLEAFRAEWEPRWRRMDHLLDSQWDQIIQFAEQSLSPIKWNFPDISPAHFVKAVHSKKKRAAVGPDGITRADLIRLSDVVGPGSIALFDHAESTGCWPRQLTHGIVSLLEKTSDALEVKHYRPVVVYPVTYRVWSSIRGRQLLRALSLVSPHGMRGGMPKCQAKSVWYEMAMLLEASHAQQECQVGIVADLEKAFNCIPRMPVWAALNVMNCPGHIIRGWAGFVNSQTRRFRVRGSLGSPISSTCGYPEGCALSVGAMAIIDLLLDHWVASLCPRARCITYVDDWQIVHEDITRHDAIVQCLESFVSSVAMKLDAKKTYVWATQGPDRTELRQGSYGVIHYARSLGAHMVYTKQKGNRTLLDRIALMEATWKLLRASLAPYFRKLQSLVQLAWPRALHAISGSHIARLHFRKLRTGALRGLRSNRIGASPMLHLLGQGFNYDPEAWAVWQTLKDARDFGDPVLFASNVSLLAMDSAALPSNGPTSVLVHRLGLVGWKALSTGWFQDEIGSFNVFVCPIDSLRFRLAFALPRLMGIEVAHRPCFAGIQQVDLGETQRILARFSSADRVFLVCGLDGTMYTRKGFQHWQQEDDNKCPFCGADDGFEHRLWECPNFDLQRNKIPVHTRTLIDALPPCSRCHGWPVRIPSQVLLLQALDAVEDVSSASYHLEHCLGPVVDLFTDGSCLLPQNHVLRLAAWAICIAKPWVSEWEHDIIASGWVAGVQQTAFRAELLAMVHAARIALMTDFQFRVWTDCLTLVTSVRRIQVADFDCGPNMAHGDLWFELRTMVHDLGGRFQVYHVFSHIPPSLGRSSVEQWIFWHNGLADKAAERANHTRGRNFWLLWSQCAWEQLQFRQCFDAIADLIVLTGRLAEQQTKSPDMPAQPPKKVPEAHLPFEGHSCSVPEKVVQKYGFPAVQWLHQWWMATGDICLQKCSHLKWVSFLQLYVDYALTTDQMGPLLWQGRWFFGTQQFPGPHLPCFAQQCRWFQMMVKSYWDHNSLPIRVKAVRPHSTSVICWLNCALLPWDDGRLAYVDEVVRHLNGGSIVKKCTAIQSFARVPMHAPWAVSPPTVGYRG